MSYGLYLSAAGMQAETYRQSVFTNNLANSQTTGFKRDLALIQTRRNAIQEDPAMAIYRVPAGPVLGAEGGGVTPAASVIDLRQSSLLTSDSPRDLALTGPGFFTVQGDKPGEVLLTRNGRFAVNSEGTLVMSDGGRAVLGTDGQPIKVNSNLPMTVGARGEVSQGSSLVGQIGLKTAVNPTDLRKLGGNVLTLWPGGELKDAPIDTEVQQGATETSGTDPMIEMVNMMEGQRVFEANAKMITYQDSMMSQLNTIGRIT